MQFIEDTIFNGSHDSCISDNDLAEIMQILGIPRITEDDASVEIHLKFEFRKSVRSLVALVEANYQQVISFCNGEYIEDDIFCGYHLQIYDTTIYDSNDGFDKFYQLF